MSERVKCSVCFKIFSGRQYWSKHFAWAKNSACKEARAAGRCPPIYPGRTATSTATATAAAPAIGTNNTAKSANNNAQEAEDDTNNADDENILCNDIDTIVRSDGENYSVNSEDEITLSSNNSMYDSQNNTNEDEDSDKESPEEAAMLGMFTQYFDDETAEKASESENTPTKPSSHRKKSKSPDKTPEDLDLLEEFRQYCEYAQHNLLDLSPDMQAGVELLHTLVKKRAPLNLYDEVFKWHMKHVKAIKFINRQKLCSVLEKRYNMAKKRHFVVPKLLLPSSKARIDLVCHDAKQQIVSLLTDPRFRDSDYLFHDNNPTAAPPDKFEYIGDINTGRSYRETYQELIQPDPITKDGRHKVLLPLIFYMDGAVTGQFANLPIEALKLTLGIYRCQARDVGFAWRNIGYVTNYMSETTGAVESMKESGHMGIDDYLSDSESCILSAIDTTSVAGYSVNETENIDETENNAATARENELEPEIQSFPAQDLHTMLAKMLEPIREMQEQGGFDWDLRYRNETYPVHFVPYIAFIKGDTVEHDKHCGSYNSRGAKVKQLCRYCCCPNEYTDRPYDHDYPRKTKAMIQPLCKARDTVALKNISQQCISNCWYPLRFGSHNKDLSVHGACPVECLHWLQLGKYKYQRDMFFAQLGKSSKLAGEINVLSQTIGFFLRRQSDRSLPRTKFSKGIQKGKLMAHEMSGVMIVLLACLRCTKGRELLVYDVKGKQKKNFGWEAKVSDWIMLIETMLQWEAWLDQPVLKVSEVERSKTKVREIMTMEKAIGKRETGMKFGTFNFHAALHIGDDILDHGVPSVVNTRSDEKHHKTSKSAALRTQKIPDKFNKQVAEREHEHDLAVRAIYEIAGNDDELCNYFERVTENPDQQFNPHIVDNQKYESDSSDEESENTDQYTGNYDDDAGDSGNDSADVDYIAANPNTKTKLGGVTIEYYGIYAESDSKKYKVISRMQCKKKFILGQELMESLDSLMRNLRPEEEMLTLRTELTLSIAHIEGEILLRSAPYYKGKPWHDWVVMNEGDDEDDVLAHTRMFLDMTHLTTHTEGARLATGKIYAIVEKASLNNDQNELDRSVLFVPYVKNTWKNRDGSIKRRFYYEDVSTICDTATVIPDYGNTNNAAYLMLLPKIEWIELFVEWLNAPHTREFDDGQEEKA